MSKISDFLTKDIISEEKFSELFTSIGRATLATGVGLIGVTIFLYVTEKRHIETLKGVSEGISNVIEVKSNKYNPRFNGKIVYLNGLVRNETPIHDFSFDIKTNSLALYRKVEMYQWEEKRQDNFTIGSRYIYKKRWSESFYPTSKFREPGYNNPSSMPIRSKNFGATDLKLGDFSLSPHYLSNLESRSIIGSVEIKNIPILNGMQGRLTEDYIYYGDPDDPQIGDIRVTIEEIPSGNISVVGRQNSNRTIEPLTTKDNQGMTPIEVGNVPPEKLFKNVEKEESMIVWIIRLVAFGILFKVFRGFHLSLAVISKYLPVLNRFHSSSPIVIGSFFALPFLSLVIAYAWADYRPEVSYGIYAAIFTVYIVGIVKFFSGSKKVNNNFSTVTNTIQPRNTAPKSVKIKSSHTKFIIYEKGNTYGPYSLEKILKQLDKGKITLMTQVCPVGSNNVLRVADLVQYSKKAA